MKMPVWHGLGFRWHSEVTCRKHREKALRCNGPHALPVIVSNVSIVDGSEVCVNRDRVLARLLASLGMLLLTALVSNAQQIDPKTYGGMKWRLIGPFRGGRVLAVTGVPSQPNTYYFGATGGGVWKTTDGGISWDPLFDKQPVSSIGAVAVADSDPNVIYVGTGEACIRGNISFGDGVYKSTDAGKTWTNVGLKDTRHIGAIIVHPANPDIVFVAALGHAYGPHARRRQDLGEGSLS